MDGRVSKPVMRGLAGDLVRRGYAVWNIEYRRLGRGQGGGWPATFADVAAAIDHLDAVAAPLDLARVTFYGHSAGGHLALWAASRGALGDGAPGAHPRIECEAAVSAAGVNDLAQTYREAPAGLSCADGRRARRACPIATPWPYPVALIPAPAPVLLVHGTTDVTVSVRRSRNYAHGGADRGRERRVDRDRRRTRGATEATSSRRARAGGGHEMARDPARRGRRAGGPPVAAAGARGPAGER